MHGYIMHAAAWPVPHALKRFFILSIELGEALVGGAVVPEVHCLHLVLARVGERGLVAELPLRERPLLLRLRGIHHQHLKSF